MQCQDFVIVLFSPLAKSSADKLIFQIDVWILQLTLHYTQKNLFSVNRLSSCCFNPSFGLYFDQMREIIAYVTSWYTNEEINMQIFRLLLAVESLCFVSHGIVLTVSHAIETLVGCSHKQILWLLVFRRRVRTGSSILLICFGFALRWRFREKIYRTIGSGGNLKDFLSSSFEFSRLLEW